ncbi:lysophospholipid acyltransferase family protein [Propionibacteriaceae bacterium G1746]
MSGKAVAALASLDSSDRQRLPLSEANQEPAEPVYRGLGRFAHGLARLLFTRTWYASGRLPGAGGIVIVSNHLSYMDAIILGEYLIWSGRWPRFLGKAELWKVPVVGWLARSTGQIPVFRRTTRAGEALVSAQHALEQGRAVTIFPEGTETRDPDWWPMSAQPGAARLALQGGWPLIPVATWGGHEIMPGHKATWPRLVPRKHCSVITGEPVDVDDLRTHVGTPFEDEAVRAATDRIQDALTELVATLRGGEQPPAAGRWQYKTSQRVPSRPDITH